MTVLPPGNDTSESDAALSGSDESGAKDSDKDGPEFPPPPASVSLSTRPDMLVDGVSLFPDESETGDSQAWLLTYTDLVTLLLVLFVALLGVAHLQTSGISLPPIASVQTDAPVLTDGSDIGGPNTGETKDKGQETRPSVIQTGPVPPDLRGEGRETLRRLRLYLEETGLRGDTDILIRDGLVHLVIRTPVTFVAGTSDLDIQGRELILKLTPILQNIEGHVTVMGGADADTSLPWQQAANRAQVVTALLIKRGIDPGQITLAARPSLVVVHKILNRSGAAGALISIQQQKQTPDMPRF